MRPERSNLLTVGGARSVDSAAQGIIRSTCWPVFFRGLARKSAAFIRSVLPAPDEDKFERVLAAAGPGAIGYACLDVANGYHENFGAFVTRIRSAHPIS